MTLSVEKSVLLHFAHVGPRKFPGDGVWICGWCYKGDGWKGTWPTRWIMHAVALKPGQKFRLPFCQMAVNPKLNPFVRSVGLSFWRSGIRVSWCPGILASWHLHIVCVPASHKQQSEHKQRWRQCQSQSEN